MAHRPTSRRTRAVGALCLAAALSLTSTARSHSNGEVVATEPQGIRTSPGVPAPGILIERDAAADAAIRDAVEAAGNQDFDRALALYRSAAELAPERGVPALARFLELTERDDELAALLDACRDAGSAIPHLAGARALAAAGRRDDAIALLSPDPRIRDGENPAGTLFLARLFAQENRSEERQLLLLEATLAAEDSAAAFLLWRELFAGAKDTILSQPELLLSAMGRGLRSGDLDESTLVAMLDETAQDLQMRGDYFDSRDVLLAEAPRHGAGAVLFATRLLNREERHDEALAYLERHIDSLRQSPLKVVADDLRGELMRQNGHLADFRNDLERRARQASGRTAVRLNMEAARIALAQNDDEGAERALARIDGADVPADLEREFRLARLLAATRAQNVERLVDIYPETVAGSREEDIELYHHVIFTNILDTDSHHAIESRIRESFARADPPPPVLWRLAAGAALAARRKPNELEALYQWASRSNGDTVAVESLARVSGELAAELAAAPEGALAVSPDEVGKTVRIAEQALCEVIRRRPWEPNAYVSLLALEEARGADDPALKVIEAARLDLAGDRQAETVAFVLATNGYPGAALRLYDGFLKADPSNMSVRMNRASCLTRLDRWDEAIEFYRTLLAKGYRGEPWHVHETVGRLWEIGKHLDREEETVQWFRDAPANVRGDWGMTIVEDFGSLAAHQGRMEIAAEFLGRIADESADPDVRARAYLRLVKGHADAGDGDSAIEVLARAEKDLAGWPEQIADLKIQRAELLIAENRQGDAVRLLVAAAESDPSDAFLADALHRAAQIEQELDRHDRALALYRAFLDSPSRSFVRRRHAEEQIAAMGAAR